ncbi:uncharacterized protein PAF06_002820 [Gastrophryne carolinensis]
MASAGLGKELECSICLSIYTDPVNLKCGHNFCRACIEQVLDTQQKSGVYSCPGCREEFLERPALQKNITLRNVVENFLSTNPDAEEDEVFCTYCVDSPVPAVKSCLHCEASLCEKHLKFHSKSPEHVLIAPSNSMGNRKCPVHKELLKYFCTEDAACICVSCCLIGEHKGHSMASLDEASENKKKEFKDILQKWTTKRETHEKRIKSLQKQQRKMQHITSRETEKVTTLFKDLRKQLDDLEKKVLSNISRQSEQVSNSLTRVIQELEIKKYELTKTMRHIEELCKVTDPLAVLQETVIDDSGDTAEGNNEDTKRHDKPPQDGGDLDLTGISNLLSSLCGVTTKVNIGIYIEKSSDLQIDLETANNNLCLSDDKKTVTWTNTSQKRSEKPERFLEYAQALSDQSFSSGRYYWDIDLRGSCNWRVGMCYPSMEKKGKPQSRIGNNNKSWGLYRCHSQYGLIHDSIEFPLPANISSYGVRIYLDYDQGKLAFHELGSPGRHLYTFSTTFAQPLHVALAIYFHFLLLTTMASADLRRELECSICLGVYTDPVTLKCGHNFCRVCIDCVLETQEEAGGYSCPECREEFQERPALHRNITLRNIAENLLSTKPNTGDSEVFCTYCVDSPVPAVKSCLMCEASLCEKHFRVHSKSPEHVLTDPSTALENRKCPVHKKILEYYCTEDSACVCVSCYVIGEHRGHRMESLDKAYENKKLRLRNILQKMNIMREMTEGKVQNLLEYGKNVQEKAACEMEKATAVFIDLRRQLENQEKIVLSEVSMEANRVSHLVSNLIQQLEIKKDELSRKMRHIEELCNTTDPLTLLQEPDTGDLCDTEEGGNEDRETSEKLLSIGGNMDVGGILCTLHVGLSKILGALDSIVHPADIFLDVDTAHNFLYISDDKKMASRSNTNMNRPQTPERFQGYHQVLSRQSFTSGHHYWEVDVGGSDHWRIGMSYPSADRKGGPQSLIGDNNKSWCLEMWNNQYSVIHDCKKIQLPVKITSYRVMVYLDYEAGQLSFYDLCDPVKLLHAFTTSFTEPLLVTLYVWLGCMQISGKHRVMFRHFHFLLLLATMASADLRKELECSICLSDYTDPVTLKCGHNFCRVCIDRVLETQKRYGKYSCPQCREEFQERPALQSNITLRNIMENVMVTKLEQNSFGIFCTYCIDSPVPAVKSCLLCEASLCERHLRVHSKSPEHVLTDPSTALGNRKCTEHKKMLEYYCTEDSACVCVSCSVIGEHRGHQMESLDKALERKKKVLKDVLQKVSIRRKETEGRVQSLQEHRKAAQQKATDMCERVTALFRELRIQLTELEKRVLSEVSRQAQQASLSLSHLIQQLEIKKDELSRKMHHIEELCNTTDPLTLLQEPDTGDLCDTEEGGNEDRETHDKTLSDGGDLDMSLLSQQFHTLSDIIREVNVGIYMEGAADILLDVNTAHYYLHISDDRKTVSRLGTNQNRPQTPKRFKKFPQVLSSCSFSLGHHYWEVDVGGACWWIIGMCYPSIDRKGIPQSGIGYNKKSWALYRYHNKMAVLHDSKETPLPAMISGNKVRIYLDYEAGKISFYESGNPSRHLHTFTATFTEPLHAAFGVWEDDCIRLHGIDRSVYPYLSLKLVAM